MIHFPETEKTPFSSVGLVGSFSITLPMQLLVLSSTTDTVSDSLRGSARIVVQNCALVHWLHIPHVVFQIARHQLCKRALVASS